MWRNEAVPTNEEIEAAAKAIAFFERKIPEHTFSSRHVAEQNLYIWKARAALEAAEKMK